MLCLAPSPTLGRLARLRLGWLILVSSVGIEPTLP